MLSASFAFFLPAALIGFLALGMVVDQKKIRENEIRDYWSREVSRSMRLLESEVDKQTQAVFASISSSFTPASDLPAFVEALKTLLVENKGVAYPFLFSQKGEMILPRFGNSRATVRSGWMEKWGPPVADPLWSQAENREFSMKEPLRAIPFYLELEKRIPRQKLPDLYFAVSRCYFKAGKKIQAREYGLAAMRQLEGAPLRQDRLDLYLLRQLGLYSMQMEMPQEAFSYYLQLYEALALRPEGLPQDLQFLRWEALDFLKNNRDIQPYLKKERIQEIDSQVLELYRGEISLFSDLAAPGPAADSHVADRVRFLKLKEIFDPETSDTLFYRSVEKHLRPWRISSGDRVVHFRSGVFQQSPFLIAFARISDRNGGPSFCFGCTFQGALDSIWPKLVSSLRLPPGTALAFLAPDERPLQVNSNPVGKNLLLAVSGSRALAGWSFRLQAGNSQVFADLALNALRWYYTLIALLFASLALGIFLLVRYLGREKKLLLQKTAFVDMVSHTLKTPLTRLRLLAEKLEQGWTADPGRARGHCRAIAAETANMAQLVDRMLGFSALQSGRAAYRFESHSVQEWLDGVLQKFKLPLAEKEFQVSAEVAAKLPPVHIDPEAMGTALSNLLENVVQYAAEGRYLGVAASANNGALELAVTDRGPGIPRTDREHLFGPFFQASDRGMGKGAGKGLGLAICRQIVEDHDGTIRAEDGPVKGTRFVITLPFARE